MNQNFQSPVKGILITASSSEKRFYNSKTIVCPYVRGDNQRALGSALLLVQADKQCVYFYTTLNSVDLANCEFFVLMLMFSDKGSVNADV